MSDQNKADRDSLDSARQDEAAPASSGTPGFGRQLLGFFSSLFAGNRAAGFAEDDCQREVTQDRRQRPVWSLVYGNFRPRRREIRRLGDEQTTILDWHDSGLLFLALTIVLLSCVDALFTLNILAVGGQEVNVLMRALIEWSQSGFVAVKIGSTAISVVVLVALSQYRFMRRMRVRAVLQVLCVCYLVLIVHEIYLLSMYANQTLEGIYMHIPG